MKRSVTHATFCVEKTYPAAPARVFTAFADREAKLAWMACHIDWALAEFDFRVGGREVGRGGPPGGPVYDNNTLYQDIVPGERIVYAYTMDEAGARISASTVTIEFRAEGAGTRLVFTEQGAFLDGHDDVAGREQGTSEGLDRLMEALK